MLFVDLFYMKKKKEKGKVLRCVSHQGIRTIHSFY